MPKRSEVCQAVIITDPSAPIRPEDCDVAGCTHAARYCFGNYYVCAECLIEAVQAGKIPLGTVVYRVQERAFA